METDCHHGNHYGNLMYPWKSQLKLTVAMEFSMEITVSMEIIGVNHHDGILTMGTWCIHGNHF